MKYQSVIARNEAIPKHANQRNVIVGRELHFDYICLLNWGSSEITSFLAITSRIRKFITPIEERNALLVFGRDKILRLLTVFLCMSCLTNAASAQDTLRNKTDSLHNNYNRDPLSNPKYYNNPPLYIIDEKLIEDSLLKKINPSDILEITVLRDSSMGGFEKRRDVIRITTKIYAQKQYQNKLSSFSKKYKDYLETNQMNDSDLLYVLNGNPLERKENGDLIKKLYDIPKKKIKTVDFMDKYSAKLNSNNNKPIVVITTKGKD